MTRLWAFFLTIAALAWGLDQESKVWARSHLAAGGIQVAAWLRLELLKNPGASFGLLSGHLVLLIGISAVVVVGLFLWQAHARDGLLGALGRALVLGGALGNLTDRLWAHTVTDFIRVPVWPATFNLADLFVRSGAVVLIVALVRRVRA